MADTELFVSHAPADFDRISELVGPVRNLPITVSVAQDVVDPDRSRAQIKRRLANSDVALLFLSSGGATDQWVNQEIGYATAEQVPLLPLADDGVELPGYVDTDPVTVSPDRPEQTVHDILSRLRDQLEPVGELTTPSWYLSFACTHSRCTATVMRAIEQTQHELWKTYEHGDTVTAVCDNCGTSYEFNPATLGFIEKYEK